MNTTRAVCQICYLHALSVGANRTKGVPLDNWESNDWPAVVELSCVAMLDRRVRPELLRAWSSSPRTAFWASTAGARARRGAAERRRIVRIVKASLDRGRVGGREDGKPGVRSAAEGLYNWRGRLDGGREGAEEARHAHHWAGRA